MGRLSANTVRGYNWMAKVGLVLLFTIVFSIFMFEGLFSPRPTEAAVAMPGAWANVSSTAPGVVSGNVTSSSFTPAAGFNRLLVAGVCMEIGNNQTVTTMDVRLDSAAGTAFTQINTTGGTAQRSQCWMGYLKESQITAGAHTIYVNYAISANTVTGLHIDVATFSGVDQISASPINSSGQNNSGTVTVTFGASAINYALGGMTTYISTNGGTPATQSTPATPAFTQNVITTTSGFTTAAATTAAHTGAGSYASSTTVTWAGTTSTRSALVVAALNPHIFTVTINQASYQTDPTGSSPINFTVVFNAPTTDFATGDVTLSGTAGATTATVTGSGTTYNVAVTGMTAYGTVIASIGAGVCTDAAGNSNPASTSTDNTVTYAQSQPCTTGGKDGPATISGIVNTYYPGESTVARGYAGGVLPAGSTSIPVGAIRVTVPAGTAIAAGDLLLVIQMQDADFNSSNNATYGDGQNAGSGYTALNRSGLYEYVTATGPVAFGLIPIQGSVTGGGLVNSYRTRTYAVNGIISSFQVIRVPQYSAATIAAATTVNAPSWNGGSGGVVILDVAGILTIDGTIDVNGLGFRGGMGRQLAGGAGANTDYRTLATNAANGSKAEGIAGTPRYVNRPAAFNGAPVQVDTAVEGYLNGSYGRGAPGNAGGGGTDGNTGANDQNSGGGGGANYGWGGKGGNSWNSNINIGGEGGSYVTGLAYNRVVMGGGGGAGSTNNATAENFTFTNPPGLACTAGAGACSSGAPGGGIVILKTKIFTGSGTVTAEGGDGYNVANDSSGGGGAGGSIVLDSQIGGVVTASVRGGDGGNAWRNGGTSLADRHGPGGGGGGGFLAYSPQSGLVVLATIDGGINGKTTTLSDYYGTTSSDGGITIFESPTVAGPKSGAACLPALTVSKSTTTPNISTLPGTATYTIKVANEANRSTAQQVVISDNLPGVPALFTNASNPPTIAYNPNAAPCSTSRTSTTNAATGISNPAWSSWDIPAGCEVSLTFNSTVPAGTVPTTYQNPATATFLDPERTTSTGTKSVTYNPSSSTAEDVSVLAPPSITKVFGAGSVLPAGSTTLTITVTNPNSVAITSLGFTDNLPTAATGAPGNMTIVNPPAPSTTCGGAPVYTAVNGTTVFTVSGLTIPAGSSCTVTITVTAPTDGIYVNTIPAGAISSSAGTNKNSATASLLAGDVADPNVLMPPTMTKSFLINPLQTGGTSVLRFILTNPNTGRSIGSAGFIDTLPTELVISTPNGLVNGCGGSVTATAGTNYISLNTNGTIPAGGTCTVDVNVTARYSGLYQNTSGQVVGDTGTGNRASDTLRVMAPIVVDKDFVTNPVATATATVLRITLTNPNSIAVTGATLTDTYPTGLVNTASPSPATTCGGAPTLTAAAGGTSLTVGGTGATIPANSSCTVTVNVQAASGGSYTNSTGPVSTTNAGTAPSASSTLNVLYPPQVRKVFSPDLISTGGQSGMQIIISNPTSNTATLTGVAISDTYTGNMTNAAAGTVLCTEGSSASLTGGVISGTTVGITGGSILPGGSCMITQLVTATSNNTNTTSAPTSTNGGTGVAATAVLKVMQPLLVAKSFATSRPAAATAVVMTIALTNPNPDIVKNITFTDTYPANLTNTATPAPAFSPANCLGTGAKLTAAAGGNSIVLENGMMYPNTSCSITVNVQLAANSSVINATGTVTTANAGTSPGDSATIATGTGVSPVELSKAFGSSTINVGATTSLVFTIRNPNTAAGATVMGFTDTLPAGLVIATPNGLANTCGGTVTATDGTSSVTLANGTLALNSSCTITVNVTGTAAGPYVNRTGQIVATISAAVRTGNFAEAAIEVKTAPSISKSFGSAYMAPGATTQLTIRIDNPSSTAITTSAVFTDTFPTSPGAMTLANGFVSNNTCSLPVWDSNILSDTSLIYSPAASPVGVLTDFGAGTVASATGAVNQVLTGAFTAPAGTSRLMLVVVELEANAAADVITVNTATYGGQNLTQLYMTPAGTFNRIYVGYLNEKGIAAALTTTLTVTLSNAAAPSWALMKAGVFSSVNQIKPFTSSADPGGNQYVANFSDIAAGTFNFGATPLTVKNNGRAMYFSIFDAGATTATVPTGFTGEMFDHTSNAGNAFRVEGGYKTIVADGTETGTNITLSAAQRYGVVGLALQPNTYTGTGNAGIRIPSGTSIPAGGCEFTVNVTASAAGVYTNTIAAGALQTNAGNNTTAASATVIIPKLPPLVTEVFVPATINSGGTSRLIMTFQNPNAIPISLTSLFTNTLPTGVVLAATPNITTTCSGGTTGGIAGGSTVTLSSGAVIPAGTFEVPGSCTLSVDVTAAASGIYTDTIPAGDLQTTAGGNADPGSAVLTVTAISPPTVSKAFDKVFINSSGVVSRLTITLSNTNTGTATLTANLVDTLPANLVIATPNGLTGTCTLASVTAIAGAGTITYASGATIPAGGCTIVVNVTSSVIAEYTNTINAGDLQTDLGNNPGPTSDKLFVVPTLVTLSDFSGYNDNGVFIVQWSTSSEMDTAGFYLFRLDEKTGRYRQINSSLLPGLITSSQGGAYSLIDNGASLIGNNTYLLMEVEGRGAKHTYGPFTVAAGSGNALENQYGSSARPAEAFLSKLGSSSGSDTKKVQRYIDHEGTIVLSNSSGKSSGSSGHPVTDEVTDYQRTAKAISAEKQAALNVRAEERAGAGILDRQRTGSMAKISVTKDGLYYMDSAEISSLLGLAEPKVRQLIGSGRLAISNQGNNVAYIPAEDMAGLFFFGQGIDSIYARENVYWLQQGIGLQMDNRDGTGSDAAGYSTFTETIHAEQDKIVAPALARGPASDYWFWDYVIAGNPSLGTRLFDLQAYGVAGTSSDASLTIRLHGLTATGAANDHHVIISLNNTVIGEDQWKGAEERAVNLSISQGLLRNGTNQITVKGLLDTGAPYSVFFVDSFDLTYQRLLEAHGDSLIFRAADAQPLTVYGFTSPDLVAFDITDPNKPTLNMATTIDMAGGNYSVSFIPSPGSRYLVTASDAAAVANAWADSPSSLRSGSNQADYVIITTRELIAAAGELADYRQRQGLTSMVIDLEDIMDEFNYGISNPEAIHEFLVYAYTNWKKGPKYVLLAGDGSYDYKDNMGIGDNLVPTLMAETPWFITPSDNLYADMDGDHLPDIAIGRLAVLTSKEMRSAIKKIITYETTAGNRVIMLVDNQDDGGDFPSDSDDLAAVLPTGYSVEKIYLSEHTPAEARQLLFSEIQTGAVLLNYTGHAGADTLAAEGLLRVSDVATLQNSGKYFVLAAMTCSVGNFALPGGFESLSEALVTKERGGAVAVWASTGLSYNYLSKTLNEQFFRSLVPAEQSLRAGLQNQKVTLGNVIVKSFRNYQITGGPAYIMDMYNLQGDPALRLW